MLVKKILFKHLNHRLNSENHPLDLLRNTHRRSYMVSLDFGLELSYITSPCFLRLLFDALFDYSYNPSTSKTEDRRLNTFFRSLNSLKCRKNALSR